MSARFNNPFLHPNLIYRFTGKFAREQEARKFLYEFQTKHFDERQREIKPNPNSSEEISNFLGFIDKLIVDEQKFSKSTIKDNIILLLLAGFESE